MNNYESYIKNWIEANRDIYVLKSSLLLVIDIFKYEARKIALKNYNYLNMIC